ncbi:hypothetical protein J6Z19_10255, partial [bacterium]|nr:hypothetical protein [bacterium]
DPVDTDDADSENDDDADTVDTDDADRENDDDADTVDTDDADSENDDDADTVDTDDADSENDDDADTVDTDDADSENDDDADTVDTDDADSENDDDADTVDTDDADSENDDDADTVDDCTYIPNYDFSEWNATANNSPTGWITKSTASYEKIVRDGEDYALRVYKTAITSNNPYVLDTPFFIPEDYAAIPTKLTFDLKTNITSRISINLRCGAGNNTDDFYAYNWDSTSESFEWNNKTNAYNKDINLGSDFKEIALIISSNVEADFWRGKQCRFEFKFGGKNEADITIDNLVLHTEEGACIKDDEGDNDDDDSDDNDGITDEDENDDDDGITDEDENDDDDEITDEDENPVYEISGAYIVRPKIPQTVSVGESVNVVVGAVKVVGITDKTLNESDDAAGEYIEAQLCTKEASAADYADENCVEAGISDYPCDLHDSYMANTKVFGSAGEYTMQYRFRVKNETWSKWEYSENQITVTVSYKIKEGEGTPYIDRPTGSKTVNLNNPLKNVVGGVYVEGLTNITSGEPDDPDGNIIEAEVCIKDADAANYADTDCVKAVANDKDLGTDDAYIANTKVFESVGKYTVQYRFRLKGNQKWVYSKNQITVTVPQQIANADFSEWEDESTPKSWIEGGITSEESQNPGIFSKECDETGDCALKVSAKRGKNEEVSSQIVFTSPDFIIDNDVLPEKINFNLKTDDTKTMVLFIKWHCDGDESYSNLSLFKWEIANSTLDRPEGFFLHPEPDEFYALYEPEGKNVSALFVIEMNSNREAFSEYSLGKTCRLKFLYSDSKSRKAVEHWAIFDDFQIVYPEPED